MERRKKNHQIYGEIRKIYFYRGDAGMMRPLKRNQEKKRFNPIQKNHICT